MYREDTNTEQDHPNNGYHENTNISAFEVGREPAHEANVCHDHDALPEFQIRDLLLKAIQLRHTIPLPATWRKDNAISACTP